MGAAVGVDHSAVARWLKGSRPYAGTSKQLADFFGVPVADLLDDSRELPPEALGQASPRETAKVDAVAATLLLNRDTLRAESERQGRRNRDRNLMEFLSDADLKATAKAMVDLSNVEQMKSTLGSLKQLVADLERQVAAMSTPDNSAGNKPPTKPPDPAP